MNLFSVPKISILLMAFFLGMIFDRQFKGSEISNLERPLQLPVQGNRFYFMFHKNKTPPGTKQVYLVRTGDPNCRLFEYPSQLVKSNGKEMLKLEHDQIVYMNHEKQLSSLHKLELVPHTHTNLPKLCKKQPEVIYGL